MGKFINKKLFLCSMRIREVLTGLAALTVLGSVGYRNLDNVQSGRVDLDATSYPVEIGDFEGYYHHENPTLGTALTLQDRDHTIIDAIRGLPGETIHIYENGCGDRGYRVVVGDTSLDSISDTCKSDLPSEERVRYDGLLVAAQEQAPSHLK
jgi:hypothetical protein